MPHWRYGSLIEGLCELVHSRSIDYSTMPDQRPRDRPMEVLGLGMSRTGTESFARALEILGYDEVYHGYRSTTNAVEYVWWRKAYRAKFEGKGTFTRDDWDRMLGHCRAIAEGPPTYFARELIEMYPDAKVILTERDADSWARSIESAVIPFLSSRWTLFTFHFHWKQWYLLTFPDLFEPLFSGSRANKAGYLEYNAAIKKLVPKDKLLVYHVSQGWRPLCEFLGKEVPKTEMPRGNEPEVLLARVGASWAGQLEAAQRRAVIFCALMAVLVAVMCGLLVRYLSLA